MVTSSRRNRFLSSTRIAGLVRNATGTRICAKTVRNRLRAARLRGRRPYVGVPLTPDHRRIRGHIVVGPDSSGIKLSLRTNLADGRLLVWRRDDERMDPTNVIQHDRLGGGSVMVWGGISHRAKTDLVTIHGNLNAMRYCNEIVQPALLPFLRQ